MKKSTVLVCEPGFLCREGLKYIIDSHPFYTAAEEASSSEQMKKLVNQNTYDLITIDISVDGTFGQKDLEFLQKSAPGSQIIVISNTIENSHIYNLLGAGVDYYICKNCNSAEILMALESAVKGEKYFSSSILDILIGKTFGEPVAREVELTSRQKELVVLIGNGNTAKEISKELNISVHTIYTHRKNIMKKLKLKSPVELITYAINIGLVEI